MQVSDYNIKKAFKNLMGKLTGYESCVFCGDMANWKPWTDVIAAEDSSGKEVSFEPSICSECFGSRGLDEVLYAVKKGITETNNTCRSYGCEPYYSDADQTLIMDTAAELKMHSGVQTMSIVLEKLSNPELIEKFESLSAEHLNVMREFFSRLNRGEISSSEFERVREISEKTGVALIDLLPSGIEKKSVEGTINESVSSVVQKAYDQNR